MPQDQGEKTNNKNGNKKKAATTATIGATGLGSSTTDSMSNLRPEEGIRQPVPIRRVNYPRLNIEQLDSWQVFMELLFKHNHITDELEKFLEAWAVIAEYHNDLLDIATATAKDELANPWTELVTAIRVRLADKAEEQLEKSMFDSNHRFKSASAMLRDIHQACKNNNMPTDSPAVRIAFRKKLPEYLSDKCREFEILMPDSSTAQLAEMLDKVPEIKRRDVCAIQEDRSAEPSNRAIEEKLDRLIAAMEVSNIRERAPSRSTSFRRQRSQTPQRPQTSNRPQTSAPFKHQCDKWCYMHQRYAYQAKRCNWKQCTFPRTADGSLYQPPENG